jgi:hypothetical protein
VAVSQDISGAAILFKPKIIRMIFIALPEMKARFRKAGSSPTMVGSSHSSGCGGKTARPVNPEKLSEVYGKKDGQ